jgi:hypothetical protein
MKSISDKPEKNRVKGKNTQSDDEDLSEEDNVSQKDKETTNLKDILEMFKKLTICLLPSTSSEKEILETLDLLFQIRTSIVLDLKSYEVK